MTHVSSPPRRTHHGGDRHRGPKHESDLRDGHGECLQVSTVEPQLLLYFDIPRHSIDSLMTELQHRLDTFSFDIKSFDT